MDIVVKYDSLFHKMDEIFDIPEYPIYGDGTIFQKAEQYGIFIKNPFELEFHGNWRIDGTNESYISCSHNGEYINHVNISPKGYFIVNLGIKIGMVEGVSFLHLPLIEGARPFVVDHNTLYFNRDYYKLNLYINPSINGFNMRTIKPGTNIYRIIPLPDTNYNFIYEKESFL